MKWRYPFLFITLVLMFALVISRLFYWQVVKAEMLSELAQSQYSNAIKILPKRGEIKTSDGFPIVTNKVSYQLFANPKELRDRDELIRDLSSVLNIDSASVSAALLPDKFWVSIKLDISPSEKAEIEKKNFPGIGFEEK